MFGLGPRELHGDVWTEPDGSLRVPGDLEPRFRAKVIRVPEALHWRPKGGGVRVSSLQL